MAKQPAHLHVELVTTQLAREPVKEAVIRASLSVRGKVEAAYVRHTGAWLDHDPWCGQTMQLRVGLVCSPTLNLDVRIQRTAKAIDSSVDTK